MRLFSVAVIEDNDGEAEILSAALLRYEKESGSQVKIVHFNSAEKFLSNYKPVYDVVFMDIELGGMSGMEAACGLRRYDENVKLIFVTNMAQYALDGYKVGAMDYFLKPIAYFDLKMRMERMRRELELSVPFVTVSIPGGVKKMPVSAINYIEVRNHNLTYHTDSGDFEVRSESLKKLEKALEQHGFARCNASYLVNMSKCKEISGNTVSVADDDLQISRALYKEFTQKLLNKMGGER